MKEAEATKFVGQIVGSITGDSGCFHLASSIDEKGVLLRLEIDKEYAGRVIGKDGRTALAIRTLLKALGARNSAFYSLKIDVWEPKK